MDPRTMSWLVKLLLGLCLMNSLAIAVVASAESGENRSMIGGTFSAPVSYAGKFYFVSTTGVLFEVSPVFSQVKKLYDGKKQTIGSLTLAQEKLF